MGRIAKPYEIFDAVEGMGWKLVEETTADVHEGVYEKEEVLAGYVNDDGTMHLTLRVTRKVCRVYERGEER